MSITFTVPLVPPTINALSRKHWTWRRSQKKMWVELIFWSLPERQRNELYDLAAMKVKVRIEITVTHMRQFDPDNLVSAAKIPLDAMKALGLIADDSGKHIELSVTQEKGKPETRFTFSRAV